MQWLYKIAFVEICLSIVGCSKALSVMYAVNHLGKHLSAVIIFSVTQHYMERHLHRFARPVTEMSDILVASVYTFETAAERNVRISRSYTKLIAYS